MTHLLLKFKQLIIYIILFFASVFTIFKMGEKSKQNESNEKIIKNVAKAKKIKENIKSSSSSVVDKLLLKWTRK